MNKGIKTFAGSCLIIVSRSVINDPKRGYKLYFVELTIK